VSYYNNLINKKMAKQKISETRITLRLSFDDINKVKKEAISKDITMTEVIRRQIKKMKIK
jgi:predicted DNA binding CopG/RHH family protein